MHNKLNLATSKVELLKLSLEQRIQEIQQSNTASPALRKKAEALKNELLLGGMGNGSVMSPTRPSHYSLFKPAAVTGKLHVR